ncbi:phosphoglucosamine mutase [uncultured Gemmiger sp.]|uniref:phosphoglucosamine mutase n=1 Tax=uncultured Gemmiger sp. TaxID=1623490 RepID=UPI0025F36A6D|nr:phosphoglucosamine mutase [uncultured Gemmiger sp.]
MGKYFGTDGFRGEANITLTADHAYKVGRFLGWYYNEKRRRAAEEGLAPQQGPARIVIGKDTRRSSYMFEYSLVGGLVASGADAYLLHVTTTPSVAYIARVDNFDCGIMISASHNPYYDNGIKLINGQGEKMDEETISLVEAYLDGNLEAFGQKWEELPFAHRDKIGCTVDYISGRNRYIGYLISLGMYSFRGVKVGLDCANGSSWNIAKAVFDALGATTYVINAEPNGLNINLNAGSTHIEGLQKFVVEKGLDVGFAYDGDADRCLCVDEKGNVVTGDHILYIYGRYMKERGKLVTNTVVTTVMSNFGLYKAFDELDIDYAKTAVGDKYVYEYMQQHGSRIGGEQSGHIIFSKYASTGDGILTSLKLMEVMMARKKPMSELAAPLAIYPQVLENVRVTDKATAQNDPDVQAAVQAVAAELGDTGRILVRESGTEPLVRVMVEAPSKEICQKYVDQVVEVIRHKGYEQA